MKDATDAMFSFGQKHGVQYLFQSPAEALVQDGDGRIVGVVVREDYGAEKYIHAERAVILTAGGFCNNKALLERYIPTAAMGCASSYLTAGETGECFRMGLGVNATCRASTARPASTAASIGRPRAASGRASSTTA